MELPLNPLYASLVVAVAVDLLSNLYVVFATWRLIGFARQVEPRGPSRQLPVSVLIPVRGLSPGLAQNLRAICSQQYDDYQVVVGIQDAADPAIDVVRQVMKEFPNRDIECVVDDRSMMPNPKISNLCNMYPRSKHPLVVLLDSDMSVKSHYLATVVRPLQDPHVGAVTCLYKGRPSGGIYSRLGAMFINEWFLPSILVARSVTKIRFCLGATVATRREVLDAIGGFARLGEFLADDYMLGQLITQQGYGVHFSSYVVENEVHEVNFKVLFAHELRWARTIRTVQPAAYAFSFVMYSVPLACLAGVLDDLTVDDDIFELGFVAIAIGLRLILHVSAHYVLGVSRGLTPWLVPVRDILSFVIWLAAFFGRDVAWQDREYSVDRYGRLVAKA